MPEPLSPERRRQIDEWVDAWLQAAEPTGSSALAFLLDLRAEVDRLTAERDDARDRVDELERWADSIAVLAPDEFDDGTGRSQESLISAWIGHVLARRDEADEKLRRVLALADRYEAQGRARSSTAVADDLRAAVRGDQPAEPAETKLIEPDASRPREGMVDVQLPGEVDGGQ